MRRCLRHRLLEGGERASSGTQDRDRPAPTPRQDVVLERRQQPGLQDRGLAAAGGPDDAQQRRARDPRDHVGDEPLAAEEDVCVVDAEARQALERAGGDGVRGPGLGALARHLQLDDGRGEIVLRRAHPRTLARGTVGGRAEPENGLVARPLTRGAVNALRHARALLEQGAEPLPVAVLAHDRLDRRFRGAARASSWRRRPPPRWRAPAAGGRRRRRARARLVTSAGAWSRSSTMSRVGRRTARAWPITRRAASGEPAPDA